MSASQHRRLSLALADRPNRPIALGCGGCRLLPEVCGGLSTARPLFSCRDLCRCADEEAAGRCQYVCPGNPRRLVAATREVGGWALDLPAAPNQPAADLPEVVPVLYDGCRFDRPLGPDTVAVPLRKTFRMQSGRAVYGSREELLSKFRLAPATNLIISGVSKEPPIERFWGRARLAGVYAALKRLDPVLITVPNFSPWSDVPREDNFYNMKRIAIVWYEMATAGLPVALHPNSRTEFDWRRWEAFLRTHPEVHTLAYEFTTGGRDDDRGDRHCAHLVRLAGRVGRPLRLVLRGGLRYRSRLAEAFAAVTYLTAAPHLAAKNARRLTYSASTGRITQFKTSLARQDSLNSLFTTNLDAYRRRLAV